MRTRTYFLTFLLLLVMLVAGTAATAQLPAAGQPGAVNDARYCGEPERTASGRIKRDPVVLRQFAKVFPCPEPQEGIPGCPGWSIDHVIPLATGGCHTAVNLQWLPNSIKSCGDPDCKDRWERIYHAIPRGKVDLP